MYGCIGHTYVGYYNFVNGILNKLMMNFCKMHGYNKWGVCGKIWMFGWLYDRMLDVINVWCD